MLRRVAVRRFLCSPLRRRRCLREKGDVKVSSFKFDGTKAVSRRQLKSVLATRPAPAPLGHEAYFGREQFEADLKRIEAFYTDRGYPGRAGHSFDVKLNDTQTSVSITHRVEEGEPVVVERILSGVRARYRRTHLRRRSEAQLPLKAGEPLDRASLQATREMALDELRDHGYPVRDGARVSEVPGSVPTRSAS